MVNVASALHRMLFSGGVALACCLIALGLGYAWIRAMHYPFTLRQRKMWTYYVLFLSAIPILGEFFMAMAFWVMPLKQSGAIAIFLLLVWMVTAFFIVRRMSRPGGRLSEERHGQD
jgi:positive regulator of sigma E activity